MTVKLTILGSSNAIPSLDHDNTHMLLTTSNRRVLIDCATNPSVRLAQAGIDPTSVTDLILTHFHPDHVSGFPLLMMNMWLMGRQEPLNIRGLDYTIDRAIKMLDLYDWREWPNFFKINYVRVPEQNMTVLLDDEQIRILTSPVVHFLPNFCLRIELKNVEKSLVYSCDTEPCQAVIDLAQGANILIHEASGAIKGHSSAAQAAEIARQAEVGALYLIHYPTGRFASDPADLLSQARAQFQGEVRLAVDFMEFDLEGPKIKEAY